MAENAQKVGWIGVGRMGAPMAERLVKAGYEVHLWNRTRAKAEPLAAQGATIHDSPAELAEVDVLFTTVAAGKDLEQVYFGPDGVVSGANGRLPEIFVDCSTIGAEESAAIRQRLKEAGADYLSAPVSGNGKCVKAGKLSAVVSGDERAFERARPYLEVVAGSGVSYVGEGELARICKVAHNVFLGVVIQNLAEITILAEKAGVPRHAFLSFINKSVMGSVFTRYKSPAFVNLDWTTTFTPTLLRKDMDLGLELARNLGTPMPITAVAREGLQAHIGRAQSYDDPQAFLDSDFARVLETVALAAGMRLKSENKKVPTGLES